MNIQIQGLNLFSNPRSKATADRMERQQKRDDTIAFFEKQKENLKNTKSHSLDDIQRKLGLLESYNEQIEAAKKEYNHSQMFHVFDEAEELSEKIAEAAEEMAPKTPEELREEIIEEATGTDTGDGILAEIMDEMEEQMDELAEECEDIEELAEDSIQLTDSADLTKEEELRQLEENQAVWENYKRIDYRI